MQRKERYVIPGAYIPAPKYKVRYLYYPGLHRRESVEADVKIIISQTLNVLQGNSHR